MKAEGGRRKAEGGRMKQQARRQQSGVASDRRLVRNE
jgi:hypothetical protein